MSGLTVDEIMKAADWSSEGVFQKFYYRPQHSAEFGSALLVTSASKSHADMENEPSEVYFQMAQVMQWPPVIRNMRKVRLKYQYVPTSNTLISQAKKKAGVKGQTIFIG